MKELTIQDIINLLNSYHREPDCDIVKYAYEFAENAHSGYVRASGEPYIVHSLATAHTLTRMNLDTETIVAGLLHDVPEDTDITIEMIGKEFGNDVMALVQGVTKLGQIKYRGIERYAENLRKMFLAMAEDVRIIFIKFADRIHNLETLEHLPQEKQKRIAIESLEIYSSIAHRLGMGEMKNRLEQHAFPFAYPEAYEETKKALESRVKSNKNVLEKMSFQIKQLLEKNNIPFFEIDKRYKGMYSLYKKMVVKHTDINEIYDLNALRIITDMNDHCYNILGIIHANWKPLPGRIKDYIAMPKINGYQSLHTTVFSEKNNMIEIQIRTKEMHEQAEFGIAPHYYYKEKGKSTFLPNTAQWIKDVLLLQKDIKDNENYLKRIRLDIFQDRIFVFTPRGDVIDLPEQATIVDFAYELHSDIGDKCERAKINGKLVALDTILKSGDVVEIETNKNRKKPNSDWLLFVKTHKAQLHIRQANENKKNKQD